jgi:nucleoside-diphosphate-sugar epimerase
MDSEKVFVAGGSGFIGSSVVRKFLNENEEVHVLARKSSDLWRINELKGQINLHYGELSSQIDIETIITKIKPDAIINCSGIVKGFSMEDQNDVIQSNLVNSINLVNAALQNGVETLFNTGSVYECGFSDKPIAVNRCNGNPIGLYGIVKRAERYYVNMIARNYQKKYVNFRLFTPFGFFDKPVKLIPSVILSLLRNREPEITSPAAGRSFIFIGDVANIYYAVAKNIDRLSGLTQINLGSPELTIVADVVSSLYRMFDREYSYEIKRQNNITEYLFPEKIEIKKLLSTLKVNLTPFQEGLLKTVEWFRDNENFYINNDKVGAT